jgi:hypothetical protein
LIVTVWCAACETPECVTERLQRLHF